MTAAGSEDQVPDGWFTRAQLEKEWELGYSQTVKLIRDCIAAGRVQMKKYRIPTPSRGLYPTQHYYFSE